jgi:nicotinate-nucleotide adenylyltransferase
MDQQSGGDPRSAFSGGSRVAFFGGSFDPPHLGHLGVAHAALAALGLDSVLFAPVGTQPLKPQGTVAGFEDRLAMTRLAIAAEPRFALSLADAPRPSGAPNYTLETLLALRAQLPPQSALFCLMGADSFAAFRRWHRAAEIPFVAPLIVASRPSKCLWFQHDLQSALPDGVTLVTEGGSYTEGGGGFNPRITPTEQTRALAPEICHSADEIALRRYILRNPDGELAPFYLLPGLHIEISASDIREQIRISEQTQAPTAAQKPHPALLPAPVLEYILTHNLYQ